MAEASAKKDIKSSNFTPAQHPPYFEMISEAIATLKERNGSSPQAITKIIEEKYEKVLPPNFKKLVSVQLNEFVKSERLVKVKSFFKISSTEKLKLAVNDNPKTKKKKKKKKTASSPPPEEKSSRKGVKTKRLSEVKTPEVLKKSNSGTSKMKPLSQVKTPEGLKQKTNSKVTKKARNVMMR
ncbi:Histone H [Parasponia andersonii]|uniref:Histone H n=1 Tax=Parasponia andersonii TaxID=3476 RepID=A0A2P5AVH6_PARAD|nr:Histone H [Parasponia andersonii]